MERIFILALLGLRSNIIDDIIFNCFEDREGRLAYNACCMNYYHCLHSCDSVPRYSRLN